MSHISRCRPLAPHVSASHLVCCGSTTPLMEPCLRRSVYTSKQPVGEQTRTWTFVPLILALHEVLGGIEKPATTITPAAPACPSGRPSQRCVLRPPGAVQHVRDMTMRNAWSLDASSRLRHHIRRRGRTGADLHGALGDQCLQNLPQWGRRYACLRDNGPLSSMYSAAGLLNQVKDTLARQQPLLWSAAIVDHRGLNGVARRVDALLRERQFFSVL